MKLAPHPIEARINAIDGVREAVLLSLENARGIGEPHVIIERSDPTLDATVEARITPLLAGHVTSYHVHYVNEPPAHRNR
jgi:hypothetical protein